MEIVVEDNPFSVSMNLLRVKSPFVVIEMSIGI